MFIRRQLTVGVMSDILNYDRGTTSSVILEDNEGNPHGIWKICANN